MADMKFHGDVIFLFSRIVVVDCCRDDETYKCSVPRTYVENINFRAEVFLFEDEVLPKTSSSNKKTSALKFILEYNFNFATRKLTKREVFVRKGGVPPKKNFNFKLRHP
jgi:hypothetical protein